MLKAKPAARTAVGRAYVQTDRARCLVVRPRPRPSGGYDCRYFGALVIEYARLGCIRLPRRLAGLQAIYAATAPIRRLSDGRAAVDAVVPGTPGSCPRHRLYIRDARHSLEPLHAILPYRAALQPQ